MLISLFSTALAFAAHPPARLTVDRVGYAQPITQDVSASPMQTRSPAVLEKAEVEKLSGVAKKNTAKSVAPATSQKNADPTHAPINEACSVDTENACQTPPTPKK